MTSTRSRRPVPWSLAALGRTRLLSLDRSRPACLGRTALLCLGFAACAGAPPPVHEYVLGPVPATNGAVPSAEGPLVGVGPIDMPGYLRRAAIVTRDIDGRIVTSRLDQWAEDLAGGFGRVLAADLASALPSARVFVAPWRVGQEPDWQVSVQIHRFERDASGAVVLEAGWLLLPGRCRDGNVRSASFREPIADGTTAATVEAHDRAVARLAGEVAAAIRSEPKAAPCRP